MGRNIGINAWWFICQTDTPISIQAVVFNRLLLPPSGRLSLIDVSLWLMYPDPPLCELEARQEGSAASHPNSSHRPKVMEKGDNFPSTSSTRYFSDKKQTYALGYSMKSISFYMYFPIVPFWCWRNCFRLFFSHIYARYISTAWIACKNNRPALGGPFQPPGYRAKTTAVYFFFFFS